MKKNVVKLVYFFTIVALSYGMAYAVWTHPGDETSPYTVPINPGKNAESMVEDEVDTGCDCKEATVLQVPMIYTDWPQDAASQTTLWNWFRQGESWTKSGNATHLYNCHSHSFGSGDWLPSPANYKGTSPGCWKLDSSGTIRNSGTYHSCSTGYFGKCGTLFLQDNNNVVYGPIPNIFKQVPTP